jgi:CBS domain-containing protein
MLFPVKNLIASPDGPEVILDNKSVREALITMVQYDYSQLPVINSEGNLIGIISDQSISRNMYLLDEKISILNLPVNHCLDDPITLPPEADVFEALDRLENTFAIVIVEGKKPIGIITDYDTTHFFRDLTEGLILVRDIEEMLRQFIESIYPTEAALNKALVIFLGSKNNNASEPKKPYDQMTFGNYQYFVTHDEIWPSFENVFYSKELFFQHMDQVRNIRNQLAHFRGRPDTIQYEALKKARTWLSNRPRIHKQGRTVSVKEFDVSNSGETGQGRYAELEELLTDFADEPKIKTLLVPIGDLEDILPNGLSNSAWEHRSWWANDPVIGNQAYAWLRAGWLVEDVNFNSGIAIFKRTNSARYLAFYSDLMERLKKLRPNLTQATKAYALNYWTFGGGRTGFSFGWEFKQRSKFQTQLYIDTGDKESNKDFFDALLAQKEEIEAEFGDELKWSRMNNDKASRIYFRRDGSINDSREELEKIKVWALETMIRFVDTFQKRIRRL